MLLVKTEKIQGIPVLIAEQRENEGRKLPLFIFMHGYTSAKEHNLHFAYALAEKGFRVVLPDALYHGARSLNAPANKDLLFWKIVLQGIEDMLTIINAFKNENLIEDSKVAAGGTSMGAIITYGAMAQSEEIKAAITLMGTPCYEDLAKWQIKKIQEMGFGVPFSAVELDDLFEQLRTRDISQQPHLLKERPLFIWHGQKDNVVPFGLTESFHERVTSLYENTENLYFMIDKNSGHKVTRQAYLKAVSWLEEKLSR